MIKLLLISIGIVGLIVNENVNSSISSTKQFHVATKEELKGKKSNLQSMGDEYIVKDGVPLHITLYRMNDELMEKTRSLREQLNLCLNAQSLNVDTMDQGILFESQTNDNNDDEINHLQHKLHRAEQKIQHIHQHLDDGDTSKYIIHLETQNEHLRNLWNQQKRENERLQSQIKIMMSNTAISPESFQHQLLQCNDKVITLQNDRKQCREHHYNSEQTLAECRNVMENLQRQLMHQPVHQTIINPSDSTINPSHIHHFAAPGAHTHTTDIISDDCSPITAALNQQIHDLHLKINQLQSQHGTNTHIHHIQSGHIEGSEGVISSHITQNDCTQFTAKLNQKINDLLLQIQQLQLQRGQDIQHLKQELMQKDQIITDLRGQLLNKHPDQIIVTSSDSPLHPQHTIPIHVPGAAGHTHTTDIIQNDCSTITASLNHQIHDLLSQIKQLQSQYDINIQTAIHERDKRIALLQTQLAEHAGHQQQKLTDCIRIQHEMKLKMLQQSMEPLAAPQTIVHSTTASDPCDCSLIIQQAIHDRDQTISQLQTELTDQFRFQQQQIVEYRNIQQEMALKLLQQSMPPLPPLQAIIHSTTPAVPCDYSSIIQQTTQQIQAREAEWQRIYAQKEQECQAYIAQLNQQIDALTEKLSLQPLVGQHVTTIIDCHTQITEALHPLQQQNAVLTAQLSHISVHPQIISRDCTQEFEAVIIELGLRQPPPASINCNELYLFYQHKMDELMATLAQQPMDQPTAATIDCHTQITQALFPLQQQNAALTAQLSQIPVASQTTPIDCVREIETAITELRLQQPPVSVSCDGLKLFYQRQIAELEARIHSLGQTGYVGDVIYDTVDDDTSTQPGITHIIYPPLQTHYHTNGMIERVPGGGDKPKVPEGLNKVVQTGESVPMIPGGRTPSDVEPDIIHETIISDCTEEVQRVTNELRSYYERILQEQRGGNGGNGDPDQMGEIETIIQDCESQLIERDNFWIHRIEQIQHELPVDIIYDIIQQDPPDTTVSVPDRPELTAAFSELASPQTVSQPLQTGSSASNSPIKDGNSKPPLDLQLAFSDSNTRQEGSAALELGYSQRASPRDEQRLPDTENRQELQAAFSDLASPQSPPKQLQSVSIGNDSPIMEDQPHLELGHGTSQKVTRKQVGAKPPLRPERGGQSSDIASADEEESNPQDPCRERDTYIYIDLTKLYQYRAPI